MAPSNETERVGVCVLLIRPDNAVENGDGPIANRKVDASG